MTLTGLGQYILKDEHSNAAIPVDEINVIHLEEIVDKVKQKCMYNE